MNKFGLQEVSVDNPFLTLFVEGIDLDSIVTTGVTLLYLKRPGDEPGVYAMSVAPFEQVDNRFTFALDPSFFLLARGVWEGYFTYKGTVLGHMQDGYLRPNRMTFIYKKPDIRLVGGSSV